MRPALAGPALALLTAVSPVAGQPAPPTGSTETIAVGEAYVDSHAGLDWLLGRGYRDLWGEPIEVEILDLATTAGGLTPVMRVGGLQTLGLALAGADGRSYTFRSIDKGSPLVLPEGFRGTGVELFTQDQVSSSLPAADLIVAPLARAAGVLHADARIVVMPDDDRLGELREAFAHVPGLFYEFPTAGSFGSLDVYGDDDFLDRRWAGLDFPDSEAFLRARLIDLLVGDWDRHYGQWRWARLPDAARLQPIPEDRDQALSEYDGLVMDLARTAGVQMTRFQPTYPDIERLGFNGSDHDRLILNDVDRSTWLRIAQDVAGALDDGVIDAAVARLPAPYHALRGPELADTLRARRDGLVDYAARYYAFLNTHVDVHGTDVDDVAELAPMPDGALRVRLWLAGSGQPYFDRTFTGAVTTSVRLYLHAGDDRVTAVDALPAGIRVRVVRGPGTTTWAGPTDGIALHDDPDGDGLISPLTTQEAQRAFSPAAAANFEIQVPGTPYRDWGQTVSPVFAGRWHRDLGLALGGGLDLKRYGFGKVPWASRHRLAGAYAIGSNTGRLQHDGDYRRIGGGAHLESLVHFSGMDQLRYYGFGNESSDDGPDDLFRIGHRVATAGAFVAWGELENPSLRIGPVVRYVDSRSTDDETRLARDAPYGFDQFGQVGLQAHVVYDSRRERPTLSSGVNVEATAAYYPETWDVEEPYGTLSAHAAGHWQVAAPVTLALLGGLQTTWGRYPYFDAAYLGGEDAFSAFAYNRFAGDSMVRVGARLRWAFTRLEGLVPGEIGLTLRADTGRVYLEGESSGRWHTQGLGGIFFAAFDRLLLFELGVGRSRERTVLTFDADLDWLIR